MPVKRLTENRQLLIPYSTAFPCRAKVVLEQPSELWYLAPATRFSFSEREEDLDEGGDEESDVIVGWINRWGHRLGIFSSSSSFPLVVLS
jgi:hypothetical protein